MNKIIGIDLGSTMSAVAVVEQGKPQIIVNNDGDRTTPSVIGYSNDGEVKVGNSAKRSAVVNPKTTIEVIKRFIGNSWKRSSKYAKDFSYDIVEGPNDTIRVKINGKEYTPQEISAEVLRKLKKSAEDYLGSEVKEAVITVPAYFDDQQRTATVEAAKIAGLECKRIINEPTAAALAFGLDKLDKDMKILVLDLGGSTADVSILELGNGVFEVVSTNGDMILGGRDLDQLITDWIVDKIKEQCGVDVKKDHMAYQRVVEAAEKAKIELSNVTSTDINLPYLTAVDGVPQHFMSSLTRAQFENLAEGFIKKVENLCKGALESAKMNINDIDEVLLVGGTTRVPKVQQFVRDYFKKEPNKSVNPDEAVALGAAIQGAILAGDLGDDIVLLDVTPLNLNITTLGDVATTMIEANTTIPVSKEHIFTTAEDNQPAITVVVTQGNRKIASENKKLGEFNLDGIAPARRGVPQIKVKFDLDTNGILKVTATDTATGKEQFIRIEGSSNLDDSEIDRMRKDAELHEAEDKARVEKQNKLNDAESLIFATERQLSDQGDKISDNLKKDIAEKLNALKAVYNVKPEDRDIDAIEKATNVLREAVYKASEELYKSSSTDSSSGQNPFSNFDFANGGFPGGNPTK